jgi:hypothetical protein
VCVGDGPLFCMLDCEADTESCPDDMSCVYVTNIGVYRCLWPA